MFLIYYVIMFLKLSRKFWSTIVLRLVAIFVICCNQNETKRTPLCGSSEHLKNRVCEMCVCSELHLILNTFLIIRLLPFQFTIVLLQMLYTEILIISFAFLLPLVGRTIINNCVASISVRYIDKNISLTLTFVNLFETVVRLIFFNYLITSSR